MGVGARTQYDTNMLMCQFLERNKTQVQLGYDYAYITSYIHMDMYGLCALSLHTYTLL